MSERQGRDRLYYLRSSTQHRSQDPGCYPV